VSSLQSARAPHLAAGVALVGLIVLALAGVAAAGSCGGNVTCKCGDTVTANYSLPFDLGPCPGHGLVIKSHVRLECRGLKIAGAGSGGERYGIFLNGKPGHDVTGATVTGCRVSGFMRGIRLRAASGNVLADNVSTTNGDFNTHVGYGIDLSGESKNNLLERNTVQGNADEGIHIGRGSHGNRLTQNVVTDNRRESLYLLAADGGRFIGNTLGGTGVNSLYLKDSSANYFEANTFIGKTARIIGDSRDNQLVGNIFSGAGLHFVSYDKETPIRRPAGNRVTGGSIKGAAECLRFTGSSGNVVMDTVLSDCRTEVRSEAAAGPSENTIVGISASTVALDEGSRLEVGWRVAVHVEDAGGAPVPRATVQANDAAGAPVFSAVTDESGNIPEQVVIAAVRADSKTTAKTPHVVSTTKTGYRAEARTVSIGEHTRLTITLRPE
jgi:parallel beta-helix repeat protein